MSILGSSYTPFWRRWKMSNEITFTVDVEPDLYTGNNLGISQGLKKFEKICDKHGVTPILFVVASTIKNNKDVYRRLQAKGWEISLHGYTHKRFDDLSYQEKEKEIQMSLQAFHKFLGNRPKGFRAPQHSIDSDTLDLLEKYNFQYDSSFTPLNFMQFLFFPKRPISALRLFFSNPFPRKIRKNLKEIPVPSFIIPPVSLVIRVLPKWALYIYFKIIKTIYKIPVFYAHSWDFIEMPKSRIDRRLGHEKFLTKLDYVMSLK
jgi:peptidoglycan/xylan/chitin deacetylase (PgdA/CDA1 family)